MSPTALLFLVIGLALLVVGAELLVRGASRLAASFGVSPLVIGLTVVAVGTSSPEIAVSVQSAVAGQADIALGNVVGSNIFNVLFILGLSALIAPLTVQQQLVRWDVPIMMVASFLLALIGLDGRIGRSEGLLLLTAMVIYTVIAIHTSRNENSQVKQEYEQEYGDTKQRKGPLLHLAFIVIGLAFLILGSRWLVHGAVTFAQWLGVSELVIGLTIIAAGTSLPEVATSVIASLRGERDIAVGNVVGSNLFNILGVLGLSSAVSPAGVRVPPEALRFDIPVMITVAVTCLPIFFTGYRIARWEGALFLAYYAAYTLYLILNTTGHNALSAFRTAMVGFVLPLTAITLLTLSVRAWRAQRRIAASTGVVPSGD